MAEDITTVLKFTGDAANAQSVIAGLITSLQRAAAQTAALFQQSAQGGNQATAALNQTTQAAERSARATKASTDNSLALARATANLQVEQGKASAAVETLKTALAGVDKNSVAAINAQRQLVKIEAELATSASRAETAMFRQAQAIARAQQVAGNAQGAIKTLGDALEKASNRQSFPALRAELQKTYLDTNYANSPLIGAIDRINAGLGFLRPLLGSTAGTLQTLTGFAGQAAQSLASAGQNFETGTKQASAFSNAVKSINDAIQRFRTDEGGSASATDFFLNLSKTASAAGDRIRATFASIRDSIAGAFNQTPQTLGLGNVAGEANAATSALNSLTPAASAATTGLTGTGAAASGMTVALGAAVLAIGAVVVALTAAVAISTAAANGLASIGEAGVKTNAQLETLKLGITTVIASVAEIRNSDGVQLKGIDALNASLPIAADQLRKLRVDALETSATIADIAPAFQAAIGPGLAAGLTIDQIRANTIRLTQAVTALGLPLDQIKQETRAILSGDINRNTQAAIALGITREQVLEAQKQGKFAELLDEKLSAAAAAGKLVAQTFAAASSNLQEAGDTFQAVVTEGLFNQIRDKANQILPQIFDKNSANLINKNFEGIAETLTRVFDTAGASINKVIDFVFNGLKQISAFLDTNQATVGEIIESLNQIVTIVGQTIADVFEIVAGGRDAGKEFEAVGGTLRFVAGVVGAISDGIKIQVSLVSLVGNAIKTAMLAPLELVLRILAGITSIIPGAGEAVSRFAQQITLLRQSATTGVVESAKDFAGAVRNIGKTTTESLKRIDDARRRAATGQRAVDGVETKTPGIDAGTTIKPPKRPTDPDKGAASKARQEAAAELKLLQTQEKQAELINKRIDAALKASLQDRLISLQQYTALAIENDRTLLESRLKSLEAEEKAAVRTAKTATEAEAKRAEFALKRAQAIQDADLKSEGLRDELRRAEEKAEEDHQQRLIQIRETGRKAIEASIRDAVKLGNIGQSEAEQQAIDLERERLAEREGLLNAELEAAKENLEERRRVQDELAKLAAERTAFEESASRRIRDAQRAEAEDFLSLLRRRIDGLVSLRKAQIDAQAAQDALRLQRRAISPGEAQDRELQRRIELLRIESSERQAAIEREAADFAKQARQAQQGAAVLIEIERQKNEALKVERERAAAEEDIFEEQRRQAKLAADPSSPLSIFGEAGQLASDQGGGLFSQFGASAQQALQSVSASLGNFQSIAQNAFSSVAQGLGSIIESFILTGKVGPAAFKKLAAGVIAGIVSQAAVKAIFELAEGLAAAGRYDYASAAKHFAAAKTYGLVAGVAAAAGAGLAALGGGNNGTTGQALSGGGSFGGGGGTRIIEQGGALPDRPQAQPQPQVIIIRAEHAPGVVVDLVKRDFEGNGVTRQLLRRDLLGET